MRLRACTAMCPVSASTPTCSFCQDRRVFVPCFSISHSAAPNSLSPVLSTSRCKGAALPPASVLPDADRGTSKVAARRLSVVWSGTRKDRAEQADNGTDQALGLPVCEAEHGAQGQRRQDRQRREPGLTAPARPSLACPRPYRFIGEPERQAAALTQTGLVGRPVRRLVLLPRDVVTTILVQLERQGGYPRQRARSPMPPRSQHQ